MWEMFVLIAAAVVPLEAQAPIPVPKAPGSFDYMIVDGPTHRLLVAHTGSHAVAILNSDTGELESQIYLAGAPHGIAIDLKRDAYLVSTSLVPQVVVIGRRSLQITSIVGMPGPVDAIALDTKRDRLYADEDNGQSIWVVDGAGHIAETLKTPQDSDKSEYDRASDRLYQNFTTINATFVIDGATSRVVERWSTLPATKPHGIALDHAGGRVYIAGTNGKLVALDSRTGKPVFIASIARSDRVRCKTLAHLLRERRRLSLDRPRGRYQSYARQRRQRAARRAHTRARPDDWSRVDLVRHAARRLRDETAA